MNAYEEECKKVYNNPELLIEYDKLCKSINDYDNDNKLNDSEQCTPLIYFLEGEEIKVNKFYKLTLKTICIFEQLTIINRADIEAKRVLLLTNIKDALININNDVCSLVYAYAIAPFAILKICIVPHKDQLKEILEMPIYDYITFFKFDHPFLMYESQLRIMDSLGRAKTSGMKSTRKSPMCFNLRSATRHLNNFNEGVMTLRRGGKMCTPYIEIDGSLRAGESKYCKKIGTIDSTGDELVYNILNMKCNYCGLENNLETLAKNAIGII